jgi:glycosyltransferase involved in cell wall biosynthesis
MEKKRIGLVVMGRIDVGGGYPRVVYDLINALNKMGKKVHLLSPFNPDLREIQKLYGKIRLERTYNPRGIRKMLCLDDTLRRWSMKKEFQKMAKEVDFIIDVDGRIMDQYLPKGFDRNNYAIWAISGITVKRWHSAELFSSKSVRNVVRFISGFILNLFSKYPGKDIKIYPLDEWTGKLFEGCDLKMQGYLHAPIRTKSLLYKGKKSDKQIVILGRIDPWKKIEDSIKIFEAGTKKYQDYKLVIIGGITPESKRYVEKLEDLIGELKVGERVKIIKNPPFERIKKEMKKSKVIIDSQNPVNITMTSIEAMAAGCIVLAHKNGGTYMEVLKNGKYGYGFTSIKEGAEKLSEIIGGLEAGKIKNKSSIKRSLDFSLERFEEKVKKMIDGKLKSGGSA